jgi:hypothetical protein
LRRWPKLIGLSVLYFLPEISEREAWWVGPTWLARLYHLTLLFFLCLEALRSPGAPESAASPRVKARSARGFFIGNLIFWGGQISCALFGYGLVSLLSSLQGREPYPLAEIAKRLGDLPDLWAFLQTQPGGPLRALGLLVLGAVWPLYFFCRFDFFAYAALDQGMGPWSALGYAWRLTQGRWLKLLAYYGICMGLNFLGLTLFFVGLVFTFPVTVAATADLYRQLSQKV